MTSTAIELVAAAARMGAALQLRDGQIVSAAKRQLPPSLRRRIADHKAEVIALLQRGEAAECPERADPQDRRASGSPPEESSAGSAGAVHGPIRDIALASDLSAPTLPRWPCRGCGSVTYWSAPNETAWICQGCHPTDRHPEDVRWHVVEDVRRVAALTRSSTGCSKCKFTGFELFADGRWTVCRCNDGFGRPATDEIVGEDQGAIGGGR